MDSHLNGIHLTKQSLRAKVSVDHADGQDRSQRCRCQ